MSRANNLTGPKAFQSQPLGENDHPVNKEVQAISIGPSKAFKVLTEGISPLNKDSDFWWRTTASYLGTALDAAGYSPDDQYESLLFYYRYILPYLGDRPTTDERVKKFKSFITNDYSPFELSWSWGGPKSSPTVRFLIEAIGPESGTTSDPYNQKRTIELVRNLAASKPDIDWQWFDHFFETLLVTDDAFGPNGKRTWACLNPFSKYFWTAKDSTSENFKSLGHSSSVFLACDLQRGKLLVKPYFIPAIRAIQTGQTPLEVIAHGVRSFEHAGMNIPALDNMIQFVEKHPELQLQFLAIAPDCVTPTQSRLKIYCRSPHTSFDSVRTMMTLGGRIRGSSWDWSMKELRKLWWLALGLDKKWPSSADLPRKFHYTSGILYNIDIKPGNTMPEPKVYIPTKHYSRDDLDAAHGLTRFLNEQGRGSYTENFMQVLEGMTTHRPLNNGSDLQTYIGCAFKKGSLDTSSYLSPAVYHPDRWREAYSQYSKSKC
ncbi:hypothetical protein MMC30_004602 [Trapelia coarctata]|nr:hypothetical protein [Trapelia coarctata]